MKMMMLLPVSALVLLVSPALTNPAHHRKSPNYLNHLFDLAGKYNRSITQAFFVEDVSHLAEGTNKCDDKFFCKVHEILNVIGKKPDAPGRKMEEGLERNLETYLKSRNVSCAELLEDVVRSGNTKPIPNLIQDLTSCIRYRNLNVTP